MVVGRVYSIHTVATVYFIARLKINIDANMLSISSSKMMRAKDFSLELQEKLSLCWSRRV